ncbi:MAG: iron-containing alcohol dehydrogenase, partial [Bacillota bacterium]
MVVKGFDFAGIPEIIFHKGAFADLPHLIAEKGSNLLLVTGGSSLRKMGYYDKLSAALKNLNISISNIRVKEEPAPELIDKTVGEYKNKNIDVVVAIGGGSVMDTGKAVSAMLTTPDDSVMRYLEKVGEGVKHPGSQLPLIAVPTTSGTGSEATKNAVLSRVGEDGFKKS